MENSLDEEGMHLRFWGWLPDSSARVESRFFWA
ncbi:ISPsy7, transposase [Escherichia coli TA464]|nr:ISPsy7, transposase [Escherichia coli TA464]